MSYEIFECWDISIPETPNRSRLFHLCPMGLGTELTESLTGFICRLAEAHCIETGTFVIKELVPVMGKDYFSRIVNRGGKGYSDCAVSMNGFGKIAKECVEAIQMLTKRGDLAPLTMLPWSTLLPDRGVLRLNRAWCQECYEEWKSKDHPIYDPLIWMISGSTVCLRHHTPLQTTCNNPSCGKRLPILNRYTRPGYCSFCHQWLGTSSHTRSKYHKHVVINDEHLQKTKLLGELISYGPYFLARTGKYDFNSGINGLINNISHGSVSTFARLAGLPKVTVWDWYRGKNKASLDGLLKICLTLGITLIQLIKEEHMEVFIDKPKQLYTFKMNRRLSRPFDQDTVRIQLEEILSSSNTYSMLSVSRKIKYDRRQLYKHFPELCRKISAKYKVLIKQRKHLRFRLVKGQIRQATVLCLQLGINPSSRNVERVIFKPAILKERAVRQAWYQTLKDLGIRSRENNFNVE
ncbi:TniQ family protein [Brevibacillus reuszeri]|uniref:HTH cro/C1-type domain-containing protein n=1 Tax=Brevibacillus reuszeri TaxID=54915 RepID=A0A0K9Z156_9BACL|nr:TniQ family protein [Brevibacillus reuszeri]KNB74195.1 hypothetical protein ADS79_03235 [Brevibacillus reuszeri]MED1861227.1 TniQ family protein [Brevibacillus reuszeri]